MRPLALRYVRDVDAVERFYETLGLAVAFRSRRNRVGATKWVEMAGGPGLLALHATPEPGRNEEPAEPPVALAFEAQEPLEDVVARLRAAGLDPETAIVDEAFGRSFTVRDPEGLLIQVNEHDRELQA